MIPAADAPSRIAADHAERRFLAKPIERRQLIESAVAMLPDRQ